MRKAAAGIKGVDTVIPGHADVTSWQKFAEYADFSRDFLTAMQAAMKAGKRPEEAAAWFKLGEKYKGYNMQRAKDNVAKIYAELQK